MTDSGEPMEGCPGNEGFGLVRQGFLEDSNVDFIGEALQLRRSVVVHRRLLELVEEMCG